MTKLKNFSQKYPVACSLLVCVLYVLCLQGSGALFRLFPQSTMKMFLVEIFDMAWPVALTILFGYGFIFRKKGVMATLIPGIPSYLLRGFLLFGAIFMAFYEGAQWKPLPNILAGVIFLFGIGVREEVIFRGIITNSLVLKYGNTTKGLLFAVIASAAMFSGIHLQNLFSGVPPMAVVAQMIGAFSMGLVLTAIYVRGGNIWVPIILHAIVDASGLFGSLFTVTTATLVDDISALNLAGMLRIVLVQIVFALFLLRKSKRAEIFDRLEKLRAEVQI